jgi:molecular chaperone GrpE
MEENKSSLNNDSNEDLDIDLDFVDTDEDGDEVSSLAKIKKLREQLKTSQSERGEYLAGWQRAKADYINLKNTEEKNRSETIKYAQEGLLSDLIPLADSFDMAFGNKEVWNQAPENWRKGIEYIYSQLMSILKDNGLDIIEPKTADSFDPRLHEAIGTIETSLDMDGKIIEVTKKGYKLQDKVLRPAQVKIGHSEK